eukprot:gnl/TRDRNA2_/TRDRNA2_172225_c3_seq1.p1 gnl/TRDRNA2_/TRDRNA2_172225_c3~~gnl/TRDRNA2_/TRDRNA2_172225_c3_seq1.p1  ORF type:complete len:604 (-),score=155.23 gnl/TRDRNA2_/TRDRNA2_172225_c3_seq1:100-1734(-)
MAAAAVESDMVSSSGTANAGDADGAAEDERMARYVEMLNKDEDSKKAVRMNRYQELLREADAGAQDAAPGASVPPLRFKDAAPKPRRPAAEAPAPVATLPVPPPIAPRPAKTKGRSAADTRSQAVGRGNLVSSVRADPEGEEDLESRYAELRKEDFVWSEHEFNDGEEENRRVLRGFKKEFKKMVAETPDGLRDPKLLTAALDLALAYVKNYELDKADAIYKRAIGECRRRGMPWDVKCIQDLATLRCKQNRQADCASLLEELANKAPPHPATFINLGTVYNQLKEFDKAEAWFQQAVNIKGGVPEREDLWNLGIVRKNKRLFDEALPMLEEALRLFQLHEPDHPVTLAKLHCSIAGTLFEAGRSAEAIGQYDQAYELYVASVGKKSPLFCSTAEGYSRALKAEGRFSEAFEKLLEAFEVFATRDAVHPTPLFESLELALDIHGAEPSVPLGNFAVLIDAAIANLDRRGLVEDGNAGVVMLRAGRLLSKLPDSDGIHTARACELLERGVALVRLSHEQGDADLAHEIMEADMLLRSLEGRTRDA